MPLSSLFTVHEYDGETDKIAIAHTPQSAQRNALIIIRRFAIKHTAKC